MKLVLFVDGKRKSEMELSHKLNTDYKIVHTIKHGIELMKLEHNLNGHDWQIFIYQKSKL